MTSAAEKKILLLVDDDSENIQVVHSILKDRYKIRVATNGAKALELAKAEPLPDLIPARRDDAANGRLRGLRPFEGRRENAGHTSHFPYRKNRS